MLKNVTGARFTIRFLRSNAVRSFSSDPDDVQSEILNLVSKNPIVVFSGDGCPYCSLAISSLKDIGKDPLVIKANWDQRSALFDLTGAKSIPNIWVKGKFVGGCNDGPEPWMGIRKLISNGRLTELLS